MLAFSYNAQDLYTALTEIAKYRSKDTTLPALQDIMITLDKDAAGPSELSYPRLHQLVNPVVDKEAHTVVSLEHLGGAKFLSIRFSDQDRNRPQLIQSIPSRTNVPFIGLVMPIRFP